MKLLYTEKNKFWVHCLCYNVLPKEKGSWTKEKKIQELELWKRRKYHHWAGKQKNQNWCKIFCDRQIPYLLWTHLSSCAKWDILARSSVRPLTVLTLSYSKLQLEKGKQILDSSHPSVSHHLVTYIFTLLTVLKM